MEATTANENVTELRKILFETIRGLKDRSIDIDTAKAINETAQAIINTAKVEVEFTRATGINTSTGFLPEKTVSDQPRAASYVHKIGDRTS